MQKHEIENLLGNIDNFLKKIFNSLKEDKIDVSNYELDHICYRVLTYERYEKLKNDLNSFGKLLNETNIQGRNISTFKLNNPIIFQNRKIYCLELPSPKDESYYKEGFEHAEFFIDLSFEEFMKKYSNLNFDTKAISKKINPDIRRKYENHSVKFHNYSLEYVINFLE